MRTFYGSKFDLEIRAENPITAVNVDVFRGNWPTQTQRPRKIGGEGGEVRNDQIRTRHSMGKDSVSEETFFTSESRASLTTS